jgi:formate-dependent phosphoribosylglycinamide formyltransferase (GAR transformylase)
VDSYNNAPAQLVANKSYTINMKNKNELLDVIRRENPTYILPEVEAINIQALFDAQNEGFHVIPNADAVNKTMNRKNIREFAAVELGLPTSQYEFVTTFEALQVAASVQGMDKVSQERLMTYKSLGKWQKKPEEMPVNLSWKSLSHLIMKLPCLLHDTKHKPYFVNLLGTFKKMGIISSLGNLWI